MSAAYDSNDDSCLTLDNIQERRDSGLPCTIVQEVSEGNGIFLGLTAFLRAIVQNETDFAHPSLDPKVRVLTLRLSNVLVHVPVHVHKYNSCL